MKRALIGYTGFVGHNIANQMEFDDYYNSNNIAEIENKSYDLVVSAANRADMWRINQEEAIDFSEINEYIDHIRTVKIGKLVLISTVGVYGIPKGADEDTVIDAENIPPYGRNRYYLEKFCSENFDTTIVRLPGLFGDGLKKNVIFDLLHDNNVEKIHKDGVYQYYNLDNIGRDINIAIENNLPIINLATPPVSTQEVAKVAFDCDFENTPEDIKPAYWDMHSKYAKIFGSTGYYLYSKEQELNDIKRFIEREKSK